MKGSEWNIGGIMQTCNIKKYVTFTNLLHAWLQLKHMHVNPTLARMVPHV